MKNKSENSNIIKFNPNPSREEAMSAVKTLIAWAGDNPNREGLIETPKRVVDAYQEFFEGYSQTLMRFYHFSNITIMEKNRQ